MRLRIFYERSLVHLLSKKYPSLDFRQILEFTQEQNLTIVEYSIGLSYDKGFKPKENDLYIWVIQPNGQLHFRQVDLASLPINKPWLRLKSLSFFPLSLLNPVVCV